MERLIEGTPGERAQVWVQERGGGPLQLRGEVVIEDLRPVLTSISSWSGANGPLNPVTQFMLRQAAARLADRLTGDHRLAGGHSTDHVPRLLSSALGHQPFVESVLQMSQHQMLRRWPQATAWYTDVINYMVRSSRNEEADRVLSEQAPVWARDTLGGFLRRLAEHVSRVGQNESEQRVAEALQILWPDFPPVQQALADTRAELGDRWQPLFLAIFDAYGLRLRADVEPATLIWAIDSLNARQTLDNLAGFPTVERTPSGEAWSTNAWGSLVLLAGSCTDHDGSALTPTQLSERAPIHSLELAVA
ncbi:MAG: hypothetical protein ACK5LS_13025 [Propioniciclava sp.]